jgi:hypothetical protein
MIDLDVVPIVIILLTFSLDLMQQRRNWLKPPLRDQPFNLQRGGRGYGFLLHSEKFSRTT